MRLLSLVVAVATSAAVAALLWFFFDRPVPVEPSWNEPLRSVSFAPFRRGQSPLTKTYPTPSQVEEDMTALVGRTRGIRTYTAREGLDVVPDLAAKYGLKVTFGAWLGTKKETNDLEVEALIKAANAHPDSIERVIVGNEVLLRRDLPPDELVSYIRRVKAAVKQPVSYADVWAFYLKNPEVGREVDYITIHILPFWEDEPVAIDHVEEHVVRIVDKIRETFPGKPILIGEAGWPSLGRDRGPAVVSTVNQARFVRQMADIAARHDFDYNIVEAFDQPWKAALENTVGASWGVLDIDRHAKFDMSGPVVEVADWRLRAGLAIAAGALVTLIFGRGLPGLGSRLVLACLAQLLSWLAVTAAFHADAVSFRWWQDIWAFLRGGLPVVFALAIIERASVFLADPRETIARLPTAGMVDRWRGAILCLFCALYAFVWTALLFFDGRYRDIPVIDFAVPVFGVAVLLAIRAVQAGRLGSPLRAAFAFDGLFIEYLEPRRTALFARGLLLAAAAALGSEGLAIIGEDFSKDHPTLAEQVPLILQAMISNREMILWALMLLLMSVPYWANRSTGHKS
ncbi:exo-beta-1,3-glucanase [Telmatospirillum sp.]|uniref:glycoside hydrolase family 17 protein n=1 Tax=Telmatospirillum sp. TaxID=2079197 RepID=UPI00284F3797|nr:exo-beta-1,3-glucanase [Telmatospirillum sp.]MDR3439317.1 exo-beta-1,3-glucanase [Telmatospirillum sp.]